MTPQACRRGYDDPTGSTRRWRATARRWRVRARTRSGRPDTRRVFPMPQILADDCWVDRTFTVSEREVSRRGRLRRPAGAHGPVHGSPASPRTHGQPGDRRAREAAHRATVRAARPSDAGPPALGRPDRCVGLPRARPGGPRLDAAQAASASRRPGWRMRRAVPVHRRSRSVPSPPSSTGSSGGYPPGTSDPAVCVEPDDVDGLADPRQSDDKPPAGGSSGAGDPRSDIRPGLRAARPQAAPRPVRR